MTICSDILKKLEEFEKQLLAKGVWFEQRCRISQRSTKQRRVAGLKFSLVFPMFSLFVMAVAGLMKTKLHFGWFVGPIVGPFVVFGVGILSMGDLKDSSIAKQHSIVLDVLFFFLSVGVSLSIGLTGLANIFMAVLGCVFVIWASVIEMVFDIATPMGLVGLAVSGTISVILNTCKSHCKALVLIPIFLGVLMMLFSWRYKKHIFVSPPPPQGSSESSEELAPLQQSDEKPPYCPHCTHCQTLGQTFNWP